MRKSSIENPRYAMPTRRRMLRSAVAWVTGYGLVGVSISTQAASGKLDAAIRQFSGGRSVQAGRIKLDIAPLVENGNAVPMTVEVESPMSPADHVEAIAVFNERNPQREVARFTLGPRCGRARVSTRIRLATSQKIVAVARLSDGTHWSHTVDVVVTLAACIES